MVKGKIWYIVSWVVLALMFAVVVICLWRVGWPVIAAGAGIVSATMLAIGALLILSSPDPSEPTSYGT